MEQATGQPKHHLTAREDRIPVFQKAIYGIGSLVNQFQAAAIGSLVIVLNLGLGMNPALVGILGAIPRLIDAFSDPMIGYSSDNTRTRFGRRRPWIFFGAIFSGILFALLFRLYKGHGESFYFWYFLVVQCLFVISFACYSIPWIALGYEMTPDYHERTRLQGFSNFFAQIAWLVAPWFFKIMNNKAMFTDIVHGARSIAISVGVFIVVGGILPAIFNKEHFANLPRPEREKGRLNVIKDLLRNCATSFKCLPFVKLIAVTFLIFNGFMLASAFTLYVIVYYVFGGDWQKGGTLLGWFGTLSSVCTLIAISLTAWVATKIGKRTTFLIAMCLAILGYALKWIGYNPRYPYLLMIAAPFLAFHLGALFTIVPSMVADVCDLDELQSGTRREGMFSGIYWWIQKLGQAGASILSGILLNVTGFKVALGSAQTAKTLLQMRLCDIGIPIITSLVALYIIMTFEITESKAYDIRQQVERRREERRREEIRVGEERRGGERRT
ncbi:MAG: MFS transporter [Candidatus Omnitrophica bacterium]|nr:MFS transporter [Candidatus Omnitrophota bacterium]MDD5610762.1 MFS transporter [Candidatus Omnitrophota bacterium]